MPQKNNTRFSKIKVTPDKKFYFVVRGVHQRRLVTQLTEISSGESTTGYLTPASFRMLCTEAIDPLSLLETPVRVELPADKARLNIIQSALDAPTLLQESSEKAHTPAIQKIGGDMMEYTEWFRHRDIQTLRLQEGYQKLPLKGVQEKFITERFTKIAFILGHEIIDYIFEAYDNDELEYDYQLKVYLRNPYEKI